MPAEDLRDVVWQNTIDANTWSAEVVRVSEGTAQLSVTEVATGQVVHAERVGLAYGAIFGPDVDDLRQWQDRVIAVIDDPSLRSVTR